MKQETRSFTKAARVFRDYESFERRLKNEYNTAAQSGMYSGQYLRDLNNQHIRALQKERATMNKRFAEIRSELEAEISKRNDITKCSASPILKNFLDCLPSNVTASEYKEIMRTRGHDALAARMIQDSASRHGFILKAAPTVEEVLLKYDGMVSQVNQSINGGGFLRAMVNADAIDIKAAEYTAMTDSPVISCTKEIKENSWQNVAESIIQDAQENAPKESQTLTEAEKAEFRRNLQGVEPEVLERLVDAETADPDGLSHEQREIANWLGKLDSGGVPSQRTIERVKNGEFDHVDEQES